MEACARQAVKLSEEGSRDAGARVFLGTGTIRV